MHTDTGPNAEPKEPEASHPGTEEPPPPDAVQEAAGGGGGTDEPPKSFDDILKQMREVIGGGETARPMTDEERRRMMRSELMARVAQLLPALIEVFSMAPSRASDEEDEPEPEAVPVVDYIPTSMGMGPIEFGGSFCIDHAKKEKASARHHGFMLGMGLGSAMSALGAATLVKEFLWQVNDLSADLGSALNSVFSKPAHPWPPIPRAPFPGRYRQARRRVPDSAMKYGAPFPGESEEAEASGYYEEADDAPQGASSGVELPDFETFMRKVVGLKARVDTGEIEVQPEIREIFDQLSVIIKELVPGMTGSVADDPAMDPSK